MTTLYLGIDPGRWKGEVLHYPVIRTERIEVKITDWPLVTHLIFTSRSAVQHWKQFEGKQIMAIGEATAQLLREKGTAPLVAIESTQEGVVALLETLDLKNAYILWPRSEIARDHLVEYLKERKIHFSAVDLYKTLFQKLEPVPSLDEIDEIVFTSPSTVEGFLRIYGQLPQDKKLTSIGPITRQALQIRARQNQFLRI